jgi:hypothetical protein
VNPGDKVRVYRPGYQQHGWAGTLLFISDAQTAWVDIDGDRWPFHPADLQPLEEPA